jgi:hypothetical protein
MDDSSDGPPAGTERGGEYTGPPHRPGIERV